MCKKINPFKLGFMNNLDFYEVDLITRLLEERAFFFFLHLFSFPPRKMHVGTYIHDGAGNNVNLE